ncbi:invasion associated locus B family protein [Yoonia sp.]|uniref:invasion associated locus B family protein n=1 Tax=Yoonia sp. TaxID=2212373 RepID=UPI003A4E483D
MRKMMTAVAMASLLAFGTQAFAQDESPEDTPTPPAEDVLDLGTTQEPQAGQIYVAENSGDWEKRCIRAPEGQEDRCNLYQLLSNADGQPVAEFNLFRLPEGGQAVAGANVVVPLETLLTQQLTIVVNGGEARRYPFAFCNEAGCVARLGLTQQEVDEFKRGANATLRLVPVAAPDEEFMLTLSLAGFTAGYDGLEIVD